MNKNKQMALMMLTLIVDVVVPYAIYYVLHRMGLSDFWALTYGGSFSVLRVIYSVLRHGKVDVISVIVCGLFAVGVAASALSGDPRFLIIKDSILTGAFALAMIGSVLFGRPLTFYIFRHLMGDTDIGKKWMRTVAFDVALRTLTLVWGLGYLLESTVRIVLTWLVPISTAALLSPVLMLVTTLLLVVWTRGYMRSLRAKAS